MIISIKLKDIIDAGKWEEFCEMFGVQLYAVNKGLMGENDEWTMTKEQAKELGII